jgi:hypothetical protein
LRRWLGVTSDDALEIKLVEAVVREFAELMKEHGEAIPAKRLPKQLVIQVDEVPLAA